MAVLMALPAFAVSAFAAANELADGEYVVPVYIWRADKDQNAHAQMIEQVASLSVKDGVRTITLKTKKYGIGDNSPITSYLADLKYQDASGNYVQAPAVGKDDKGFPAEYVIVLPTNEDILPIQQHSIFYLGNTSLGHPKDRPDYVDMRLKIDYDNIKPAGESIDGLTSASYTNDAENVFFQFFKQLGL